MIPTDNKGCPCHEHAYKYNKTRGWFLQGYIKVAASKIICWLKKASYWRSASRLVWHLCDICVRGESEVPLRSPRKLRHSDDMKSVSCWNNVVPRNPAMSTTPPTHLSLPSSLFCTHWHWPYGQCYFTSCDTSAQFWLQGSCYIISPSYCV